MLLVSSNNASILQETNENGRTIWLRMLCKVHCLKTKKNEKQSDLSAKFPILFFFINQHMKSKLYNVLKLILLGSEFTTAAYCKL